MIVNRKLRQFISHPKGWHLSCRFYVNDIVELNGSGIIVTIERIDNDGYYRSGIWCFSDLDVHCKL
jgi:hypothetical protein